MKTFRFFLAAAMATGLAQAETIGSGMADRTRYDGPSYNQVWVRPGDAAACRETCRGDLRCYAWNYRRALPGDATAQCDLLAEIPTLVWDDEYISGEISRAQPVPDADERVTPRTPDGAGAPPPPYAPGDESAQSFWSRFNVTYGSEAAGEAYASWTYAGKGDGGVTRCAKACVADSNCSAFVLRSDAELAPKPEVMCELKAGAGSLLRNPDALSGVKR
jgi:hypothetical protein